jgi:hypothetical protein
VQKHPFRIPRWRWEDNIQMDLLKAVRWVELNHGRSHLVLAVWSLPVLLPRYSLMIETGSCSLTASLRDAAAGRDAPRRSNCIMYAGDGN